MPKSTRRSLKQRALAVAVASCYLTSAQANPSGPTLVQGSMDKPVTSGPGGKTLTIGNVSSGTIVNWDQFSIQRDEITRLLLTNPAGAMLNRVTGANPSDILGQLYSNGRIFLINPSGITF